PANLLRGLRVEALVDQSLRIEQAIGDKARRVRPEGLEERGGRRPRLLHAGERGGEAPGQEILRDLPPRLKAKEKLPPDGRQTIRPLDPCDLKNRPKDL